MRSPLPLTSFEAYMLADDRPSHPMTFSLRLELSGELCHDAFRQALASALQRHPLLTARIVDDPKWGACWNWSESAIPFCDIAGETEPLRYPGSEQIDLRSGCGLRIWVRLGTRCCQVRLQFHHAVTDGVGAFRFVEDLLCEYHNRRVSSDRRVVLRPINKGLLSRRGQLGLTWWQTAMRLPCELWGMIVGFATFFLRRPARVHRRLGLPTLDPLSILELPTRVLGKQEFALLRARARRHGVTLNDLLTRDLCQAMHAWNVRHGSDEQRRPIRIAVPVNLRTEALDKLPAANAVAMVFVDRKPAWYPSSNWLLKTIHYELNVIKRLRLAWSFVRGTSIVRRIPGGLRFLTRGNRCYATCVFSNVGVVLDKTPLPQHRGVLMAGGLRLEAADFATTVRPHTPLGFTCTTYAGRLRLVLNYDRHALSADTAQAILRTFLSEAGIGTAASPANVREALAA